MLNEEQIIARLDDAGVRKAAIAKTLGIPDSRVAEIYGGRRKLKLEEAIKLVETYKLEDAPQDAISPIPLPVARLLVLYVAKAVGAQLAADSPLTSELAGDIRAFAVFASDRRVRDSLQSAEGFLQGIQARRLASEASPPTKHRHPAR